MKENYIQNIKTLLPLCDDESLLDLIYKLLLAECGNDSSEAVVLFCG